MSIEIQAGIAVAMLLVGFVMARWAARYDLQGFLTDSVWRTAIRSGLSGSLKQGVAEVDAKLKAQLTETVGKYREDSARLGHTKAAVKHGALFAVAYGVGLASKPIMIIGLLLLAHAGWRLWG